MARKIAGYNQIVGRTIFPTQLNEDALNELLRLEQNIINSENKKTEREAIEKATTYFDDIAKKYSSCVAWSQYICRISCHDENLYLKVGIVYLIMAQCMLNLIDKCRKNSDIIRDKYFSDVSRNFSYAIFSFREAGDIARAVEIQQRAAELTKPGYALTH